MNLSDLDFDYPPDAVATQPSRPTRVMWWGPDQTCEELSVARVLVKFSAGDVLVLNDTKVIPARVVTSDGVEILFIRPGTGTSWSVLFPARDFRIGDQLALPGGVRARITAKGLPQTLELDRVIDAEYLDRHGEFALPPYIQSARGVRRNDARDVDWYQTAWAAHAGSVAAPTASLHFSNDDLRALEARGVNVARVTLHVGPGTFLPVRVKNLDDHVMHAEVTEVPRAVIELITTARARGHRVWALGTTVTRALESQAAGLLEAHGDVYRGETKLFIRPPYQFKYVDVLLTNFHQPRSTLLALVAAFAGLDEVKRAYAWAIARNFKLFSYGDLSAWIKP